MPVTTHQQCDRELTSPLHKAEPQMFVHICTDSQPSLHTSLCYIKNLKSSRIKNTCEKRTFHAEASSSMIKSSSWNAVGTWYCTAQFSESLTTPHCTCWLSKPASSCLCLTCSVISLLVTSLQHNPSILLTGATILL